MRVRSRQFINSARTMKPASSGSVTLCHYPKAFDAAQAGVHSARNARALYVRIGLERMVGNMDGLLEQFGSYSSPPVA